MRYFTRDLRLKRLVVDESMFVNGVLSSAAAPTTDQGIPAGYSAYSADVYEIASGKFLEIGDGAVFEIG